MTRLDKLCAGLPRLGPWIDAVMTRAGVCLVTYDGETITLIDRPTADLLAEVACGERDLVEA